tara:strand:+ start:521 stop:691 length:171 start_codon:yes stop_codon:yes gene_type:complete
MDVLLVNMVVQTNQFVKIVKKDNMQAVVQSPVNYVQPDGLVLMVLMVLVHNVLLVQ